MIDTDSKLDGKEVNEASEEERRKEEEEETLQKQNGRPCTKKKQKEETRQRNGFSVFILNSSTTQARERSPETRQAIQSSNPSSINPEELWKGSSSLQPSPHPINKKEHIAPTDSSTLLSSVLFKFQSPPTKVHHPIFFIFPTFLPTLK
mmetsp:Transcript_19615/g.39477  ORF Transcript_19615/g.39477 Transcript_19615/m.39477 type:complete len:149 (-) Transcript_19615:52-498(-)